MQRPSAFYQPSPASLSTGLLFLRLFVGLRLLYGVVDNLVSWGKMNEFAAFLQQAGFPLPLVSAVVSVYAQAVCGLLILAGLWVRPAAVIMVVNFLVALFFVHVKNADSIEAMTPALAMFFGSLTLAFTGGGRYGIAGRQSLKS